MNLLKKAIGAIYRRYFGSKLDLIIQRTWEMDAELHSHVHGVNLRLIEVLDRLDAIEGRLKEFEQGSKSLSTHWDEAAIARRLAALEDQLIGDDA
jgi:hypothetical protein